MQGAARVGLWIVSAVLITGAVALRLVGGSEDDESRISSPLASTAPSPGDERRESEALAAVSSEGPGLRGGDRSRSAAARAGADGSPDGSEQSELPGRALGDGAEWSSRAPEVSSEGSSAPSPGRAAGAPGAAARAEGFQPEPPSEPPPQFVEEPPPPDPAVVASLEEQAAQTAEALGLIDEAELAARVEERVPDGSLPPDELEQARSDARRRILADEAIVEDLVRRKYGPDADPRTTANARGMAKTLIPAYGPDFRARKLEGISERLEASEAE